VPTVSGSVPQQVGDGWTAAVWPSSSVITTVFGTRGVAGGCPARAWPWNPFREVQCGVAPLVHRSREPRVVDGGDGEVLLVSGRAAGRFELVSSPTAARMHVGGSEYAGVYQSEMTYTLAVGP
jgi:hypothetical protein